VGYNATIRGMEAAQRRQQREAQKRFRELERQAKEQAKRSTIDQARFEVERFENELEVLLSVHKEQGEIWDWLALAASLPPHPPRKFSPHELKARQQAELASLRPSPQHELDSEFAKAQAADEQEFQEALTLFSNERAEWEKMKVLAPRVLAGEHKAYVEALVEFIPLAELSNLGSSIYFTVHHAKLLECVLKVSGRQIIPAEAKSLTVGGKLSVKVMPKARFHEIYQDYVCGCVLRVAREVFALLPVETVLVTSSVDTLDSSTGRTVEQAVLSVAIPRAAIADLNFDALDPSDAMERFLRRGDLKASRKSGEFVSITPLALADLSAASSERTDARDLLVDLQRLRNQLKVEIETMSSSRASVVSQSSLSP
jgi:hypothetical protein